MPGRCSYCQGQGAGKGAVVVVLVRGLEKEATIWFHDWSEAKTWERSLGKRFVRWVEVLE